MTSSNLPKCVPDYMNPLHLSPRYADLPSTSLEQFQSQLRGCLQAIVLTLSQTKLNSQLSFLVAQTIKNLPTTRETWI